MEQLWYTWSSVGFGVATGLRVRAASKNLVNVVTTPENFQELGLHVRYDLPQEREASVLKPEETATCLAFIKPGKNPKEPRRILVSKRHAGYDAYHRAFYFTHMLDGLPKPYAEHAHEKTLTARDAIRLWKSRFWQYSAESLKPDDLSLPQVADDLSGRQPGVLTEADLQGLQQELEWVILAFLLVVEQEQQVYIAAHPDVVARLIWGLTHAVSSGLMRELTFSTYEKTATSSKAMIVGTCWSSTAQKGDPGPLARLPLDWGGLAVNWYTGEPSRQLREARGTLEADFAQFAAAALVKNQGREALESLKRRAENQRVTTVKDFLAAYEYVVRGNISLQAILSSLREPASAEGDLDLPAFQVALMNLASTQPKVWKEQAEPLLKMLRQQAAISPQRPLGQSLLRLARDAAASGESALRKADEAQALVAFEVMEAAAPADAAPEEWAELFKRLSGAKLKPTKREGRNLLWRNWLRIPDLLDEQFLPFWLAFPWQIFETVATFGYPETWYRFIMHNWLRQPFPENARALVSKYAGIFIATFGALVRDRTEWEALEQFLAAFVQAGGKSEQKKVLLEALLAPRTLDQEHIVRLFRAARLNADEAASLLEERGQSGALEGVFELLLTDDNWRQQMGKRTIKEVRTRAGVGQDGWVRSSLKSLIPRSRKSSSVGLIKVLDEWADLSARWIIADARDKQQLKRLSFFQEALPDLAPPESNPDPWVKLLEALRPGPELPESFQSWLLNACAKIENLRWEQVLPWLKGTWSDFEKLFGQGLPANWYLAMFASLLEAPTTPLPKQALGLVEKYGSWFAKTALPELFAQAPYREPLIGFFEQLAQQGCRGKVVLLCALLAVSGVSTAQVERLWELAHLQAEEEDVVLEEVGSDLIQARHRGPRLLHALVGYLARLAPRDQERQKLLIRQIQQVAQEPAGKALLSKPLDTCVERAKRQVEDHFDDQGQEPLSSWVHLLQAVAPPKENPGAWVGLMGRFPAQDKFYLLAEMLSSPKLKREVAEKYWKTAALAPEERSEFMRRFAPGVLADEQVSSAVKEFLREKQSEPPAPPPADSAGEGQPDQEQAGQAQEVGVVVRTPEADNPPQNRAVEVPPAQQSTSPPQAIPDAGLPGQGQIQSPPLVNEVTGPDFWQPRPLSSAPSVPQQALTQTGTLRYAETSEHARGSDLEASWRIIDQFRYYPDLQPRRLRELAHALRQVHIEQQAPVQAVLIPGLADLIQSRVGLHDVLETLSKPLGYKDRFELYTLLVKQVKAKTPMPHLLAKKLEPYLLYPFELKRSSLSLLQAPDNPHSPYPFLRLYIEPALEELEKKHLKEIDLCLEWAPPDFREAWKSYRRLRKADRNQPQGQTPAGKGKLLRKSKLIILVLGPLLVAAFALLVVLLLSLFGVWSFW